jgi:hypothetical protein
MTAASEVPLLSCPFCRAVPVRVDEMRAKIDHAPDCYMRRYVGSGQLWMLADAERWNRRSHRPEGRERVDEKRWPFVESPGEFADRLNDALNAFGGYVLGAVRNVLIENPPELAQHLRNAPAVQPQATSETPSCTQASAVSERASEDDDDCTDCIPEGVESEFPVGMNPFSEKWCDCGRGRQAKAAQEPNYICGAFDCPGHESKYLACDAPPLPTDTVEFLDFALREFRLAWQTPCTTQALRERANLLRNAGQRAHDELQRLRHGSGELVELVRRYASECGECGGKGWYYVGEGVSGRGPDDVEPGQEHCSECADIRAALANHARLSPEGSDEASSHNQD